MCMVISNVEKSVRQDYIIEGTWCKNIKKKTIEYICMCELDSNVINFAAEKV